MALSPAPSDTGTGTGTGTTGTGTTGTGTGSSPGTSRYWCNQGVVEFSIPPADAASFDTQQEAQAYCGTGTGTGQPPINTGTGGTGGSGTNCNYQEPGHTLTFVGDGNAMFVVNQIVGALNLKSLGWQFRMTHEVNGVVVFAGAGTDSGDTWNGTRTLQPGVNHFIGELSKTGCATHIVENSYTLAAPDCPPYVENEIALSVINFGLFATTPAQANDTDGSGAQIPNSAYVPSVVHTNNGADASNSAHTLIYNTLTKTWQFSTIREPGVHVFTFTWTAPGCPNHVTQATYTVPPLWCLNSQTVYAASQPAGATGPYSTITNALNACGPPWPGPGNYCYDDVGECHVLNTQEEYQTALNLHTLRGPVANCTDCVFGGDGDCCPPFHYYNPDTEECVLVPVCPPAAAAPIIGNKIGGSVTVSFTQWPQYATSVDLFQGETLIHSFAYADVRSFVAENLLDFATYEFKLRGRNDSCNGPKSPGALVTMVSDSLTLTWVTPSAGQEITREIGLVGTVVSTIGLSAVSPVQMFCNGAGLGDLNRVGTQWSTRFNPLGADFAGDITFRLQARDALGLSAFVDVTAHLSVSLAKLTRYEHDGWTHPAGLSLGQVALTPRFDTREPGAWIDAFVSSPGKGGVLPYDDFAAMEEELLKWQNVAFDSPFTVLGTKSGTNPSGAATERMEIVLRFTPPQIEARYQLNATQVARVRRIDETTIEALTLQPARVVEVTPEGVATQFDITARGFVGVVDACRWREDKVVVATSAAVWVCEMDASSADFRLELRFKGSDGVWHLENKPCVGVEVLDEATFYLAFADATGSRIWKVDGTDPALMLETSERITFLRAQGNRIAFATASNQIRDCNPFTSGGHLLYQHNATITELGFSEDDEVTSFADATRVWALGESSASKIGDVPGQMFGALGLYQGFGATLRITAGGQGGAIYCPGTGGAFLPVWTVGHGATAIKELGRFLVTYVEAQGDPLMGGTPAIESEVLVAFCETGVANGAFVALIEKSRQNSDTSRRARAVTQLIVIPA